MSDNMKNAIFTMKRDKPAEKSVTAFVRQDTELTDDVPPVVTCYKAGESGLPPIEVPEGDDECCCKKVQLPSGFTRYYVLMEANGRIYDPWNPLPQRSLQYAKNSGKDPVYLKEVVERCFLFYIRYLETQNNTHKIHAEREALTNG